MLEDSTLWITTATRAPGTLRFKAPELLSEEQQTVTISSDMYAFGMTCLVSYLVLNMIFFKLIYCLTNRKSILDKYHSTTIEMSYF
jgi:serine/threonine protein kinase